MRYADPMSSDIFVVSCVKNICADSGDAAYTVSFSSGESLDLTDEEVIEFGLYCEGAPCGSYDGICTAVFSKRMTAYIASYVLFTSRTEAQIRKKIETSLENISGSEKKLLSYAAPAAEKTIDRLKELGYVDDRAYAERFVSSLLRDKHVSRADVMNRLVYSKGIDAELAGRVCDEFYENNPEISDESACEALIRQKCRNGIPEEQKELLKLYRYLAGKGFSPSDVRRSLEKIISEDEV